MRRRYLLVFAASAALAGGLLFALSCVGGPDRGPAGYSAQIRPDAPAHFIMFGDTRRTLTMERLLKPRYDTERGLVIQALAAEDPAFIVNSGDLVCHGSDPDEWRVFNEENQPIFSKKIPYYPGLGNHEYYSDNEKALENYFSLFPYLNRRKWYEVRFRSVLVAVLDSNFDDLEESEIQAQDKWFAEFLAAAARDESVHHVIVCCHHSPYTNARIHGDSRRAQEHFVAPKIPKVKVFVTGHVHTYERFLKDGVQFVVSGGGGAPLVAVDTDAPRHPDLFKGPEYRNFHYCRFTLEGAKLACDVMMMQDDRSWKRVDGFECP